MKGSEALHEAAQRLSVAAAAGECDGPEPLAQFFALEHPVRHAGDELVDLVRMKLWLL